MNEGKIKLPDLTFEDIAQIVIENLQLKKKIFELLKEKESDIPITEE